MNRWAHQRFEGRCAEDQATGCQVWIGARKEDGSGLFVVSTSPRHCTNPQRYAYSFYKGPVPKSHYVQATCGNKLCVTLKHLRLVSRRQVILDSIKAGRWTQLRSRNLPPVKSGEKNPNSRYSNAVVRVVRGERAKGDKLIVISVRHKIPLSSVDFICNRRKGYG